MLYRNLFMVIFLALAKVPFAQETQHESSPEYNRKKISIEMSGGGIFSTPLSETWRSWKAYQGFSRISESDLFNVTGYFEEAKKAKSYHTTSTIMEWSGIALLTAGLTFSIVSAAKTDRHGDPTNESRNFAWVALGSSVVGFTIGYIGWERNSKMWAPYAVVAPIADEYNYRLGLQLGIR